MANFYPLAGIVVLVFALVEPASVETDRIYREGDDFGEPGVCLSKRFCISYEVVFYGGLVLYFFGLFLCGVCVAIFMRAALGQYNIIRNCRRLCDWCQNYRQRSSERNPLVSNQQPVARREDLAQVVVVGPSTSNPTGRTVGSNQQSELVGNRIDVDVAAETPPIIVNLQKWKGSINADRCAAENRNVEVHASPKRKIVDVDPPNEDRPIKSARNTSPVIIDGLQCGVDSPGAPASSGEIGPVEPRSPTQALIQECRADRATDEPPSQSQEFASENSQIGEEITTDPLSPSPDFHVIDAPSPAKDRPPTPFVGPTAVVSKKTSTSSSSSSIVKAGSESEPENGSANIGEAVAAQNESEVKVDEDEVEYVDQNEVSDAVRESGSESESQNSPLSFVDASGDIYGDGEVDDHDSEEEDTENENSSSGSQSSEGFERIDH